MGVIQSNFLGVNRIVDSRNQVSNAKLQCILTPVQQIKLIKTLAFVYVKIFLKPLKV